MTDQRTRDLAARLSPEDRQAMADGHYCTRSEPQPRKERVRPPAPPHAYSPCRIYDQDGLTIVCQTQDCQDDRHRIMAALGVVR